MFGAPGPHRLNTPGPGDPPSGRTLIVTDNGRPNHTC